MIVFVAQLKRTFRAIVIKQCLVYLNTANPTYFKLNMYIREEKKDPDNLNGDIIVGENH